MTRLVVVAACALIDGEGRVLLAERPAGKAMAGLWEFPGGKVEANESPEGALVRELDEELGVHLRGEDLVAVTFASHAYPDFHLLMPLYLCRRWKGVPQAREGQRLDWVAADTLGKYPMPPADLPLIGPLTELL